MGKCLWGPLPLAPTQNYFLVFSTHVNLGTPSAIPMWVNRDVIIFIRCFCGHGIVEQSGKQVLFVTRRCQHRAFANWNTTTLLRPVHNAAAYSWPLTETHASVITSWSIPTEKHRAPESTLSPALLSFKNRVNQARGSAKTGKREVLINVLTPATKLGPSQQVTLLSHLPGPS